MKNNIYLIFILKYILIIIKIIKCEDLYVKNDKFIKNFSIDFIDFIDKPMDRMNLEFDPNTNSFVNEEMLFSLYVLIIINENNICNYDIVINILFYITF